MKKFSTSFGGYNKYEVNEFVDDVTKNYEEMLNRLKKTDEEVRLLREELIKAKEKEIGWAKAFQIAEEASSQIRKVAKDESNAIIDDAKRNASRILNDALIKAEKVEADAQELRHRVEVYKRKVKEVIDEQKEMIDEIGEIRY